MEKIKKVFARQLRQYSTNTEKIVWETLRDRKFLQLKFRRQFVLEGFVVDFYCHKLKLAIELDGEVHGNQKEYDEQRQCIIESEGISFIRATNEDVERDINGLLNRIREFRDNFYGVFSSPPLPSANIISDGRGGRGVRVFVGDGDHIYYPAICTKPVPSASNTMKRDQ